MKLRYIFMTILLLVVLTGCSSIDNFCENRGWDEATYLTEGTVENKIFCYNISYNKITTDGKIYRPSSEPKYIEVK